VYSFHVNSEGVHLIDKFIWFITLRAFVKLKFSLLSREVIKWLESISQDGDGAEVLEFIFAEDVHDLLGLSQFNSAILDVCGLFRIQFDDLPALVP